ncbi:MAG: hypothetical protein V3S14_00250 [Anaerolineae bacterium]
MVKKSVWIVLGVLVLLAITTSVAGASGKVAPFGQDEKVTTNVLWTALAPLIAIATFIERALEVFWEGWENKQPWPNSRGKNTSAQEYIRWKKASSQWLGTLVAVIAIGLTNVRLFRLLGFDVLFSSPNLILFNASIGGIFDSFTVGTLIDWLLTAAVIGWGGTELTHNVIEGLVKGRNVWKETREVAAGERSIADAKFFNEYVGKELEKRGVSVASLRQAIETMEAVGVPVSEFVASMTVGKVDEFMGQLEAKPETAEAAQALRTFLEGVPEDKKIEIPSIPNFLNLLTDGQRKRFLGA